MSKLDLAIFNPDEAFFEDPYAVYRELRNRAPAYLDEASGWWLITRFADVDHATTDYETFSSSRGNVTVDSPFRVGKTLGSMDPPRHDELRRIIQRTLAPARIATLVAAIKAETRARLDHLRDQGGSFDFVADFSRPLLFSATGKLLGLDDAATAYSTELTADLFHHDDGPMGAVLPPTRFEEIAKFLGDQLASRQVSASDDLFSVLLEAKEAGAPLNDQEIVANLSTVLLAGNASIGHFFPNLIHALWLHPDERRKLIDDPSKILAAVEEAVRWDTSTQSFARHIIKDVEIEGVTIPADSRAVIFYASANRDERAIDDPDRFDIDRRRVKHFGFGAGAHHCAGAHVARVILKAILEEALDAFGEYELDPSTAKRVPHVMVRGFMNLPMSFGRN